MIVEGVEISSNVSLNQFPSTKASVSKFNANILDKSFVHIVEKKDKSIKNKTKLLLNSTELSLYDYFERNDKEFIEKFKDLNELKRLSIASTRIFSIFESPLPEDINKFFTLKIMYSYHYSKDEDVKKIYKYNFLLSMFFF